LLKNGEGESVQRLDFLTEEEYLNILDTLPADNQY
jgi:DNA-directed RNA polymerase subunit beta'